MLKHDLVKEQKSNGEARNDIRAEEKTHISMFSNSSRFRCLLKNAAARFFTRRASRLLSPETSGGTKSFVLVAARGFLLELAHGVVLEARFAGTMEARPGLMEMLRRSRDSSSCRSGEGDGDGDGDCSMGYPPGGISNTWCVGRQRVCSVDVAGEGTRLLRTFAGAMGDGGRVSLPDTEFDGEGANA